MLKMNFKTLALSLGFGLLAASASAQDPRPTSQPVGPSLGSSLIRSLPENYVGRFASTELLASSYDGFGVRYFPLPLEQDIRVSLAKRPKYWEYNVTTRYKATTFGAGIFDNGPVADKGIPRLEATHDPDTGWQYGARWQQPPHLSRASVGYATRILDGRFRVLNNVGWAYKGEETSTLFTETLVFGVYSKAVSPQVTPRLTVAGRLYSFPLLSKAEASVDLVPGVSLTPAPNLNIDISHLERFAPKDVPPVPDFNFDAYRESYLSASYRIQGDPNFSVGLLRGNLVKNWVGDGGATTVKGEVLFRTSILPSLVGPSVSYRRGASEADTRWVYSLSFGPK